MSHLKNYLVFIGEQYYPAGGWLDFKESFETREEAKKFVEKLVPEEYDWGQVIFIGDDIHEELVTEFYYHDRRFNSATREFNDSTTWADSID